MDPNKPNQNNSGQINRRTFLKGMVAAGVTPLLPATFVFGAAENLRRFSANDKVNVACVGIGNRGSDDVKAMQATGLVNIVAFCDTEMGAKHTLGSLKDHPNVPQFRDFRTMFDKMGKEIDAVCIATPDHSHFPIAMLAMSMGKHVYVEKPIAHSFKQIELMMAAEKKYKVVGQMGNQGHSEANYFQFKAWTEAGVIKNVKKITSFMNSSRRWHGMVVNDYFPAEATPDQLDWDLWNATAHNHPFNHKYLNGEWRSWYDYGDGALGDWGAHIFDTAHEFLHLGLPTEVDPVRLDGHSRFIFPQATTLEFKFPERGSMPPLVLSWYDGVKNLPPLPAGFGGGVVDPNIPPPTSGTIETMVNPPGKVIYGEGHTFKGGSHGSTLQIINNGAAKDINLPDVQKSPSNHYVNFIRACKGEETCRSNFAVSGPLCQTMAIGIIAQRVGAKVEFDAATKQITNHKVANELLNGAPPRKDWEQFYKL